MIRTGTFSEWLLFHENDWPRLKAHFDAGGTVAMLNGSVECVDCALCNCVNSDCDECLEIMMANGAIPDTQVWHYVLLCSHTYAIHLFFKYGFFPSKSVVSLGYPVRGMEKVAACCCSFSVVAMLGVARRNRQPLSSMFGLIAKTLWGTRKFREWLALLPE